MEHGSPANAPVSAGATDVDALLQAVFTLVDGHDASDSFGETSCDSTVASPPSTFADVAGDSHGESSDSASSPTSIKREKAVESDQHAKQATTSRPSKGRTAMRSDKRQREEMIALREESLSLQDQLNTLKSQLINSLHGEQPQKKRMLDRTDEAEESQLRKEEMRKLRAQAWQAMTELQQKRREAAEEERERLKHLIDLQKKSFRQLRRYLVRHAEKHCIDDLLAQQSLFHEDEEDTATESYSETDEADFKEITRALPTMRLQTSGLFTDARLDNLLTTMRDVKIQNEESHKMTIEALESSVVPFDMETTANAVWQHHLTKTHGRINSPKERETLETTDNSIRRTFRAAIEMNGHITRARGRVETRRYIESNRVVIVQTSIMDRIEHSSISVPNFAIRNFQWTVIGPPRHAMLRESDRSVSQVEVYGVNVPTLTDFIMDEGTLREAIKRGCVEAVGLQLEFERQSVENILMEKLMQSTNVDRKMLQVPEWC